MLVLGARQSNNASLAATQAARGQRSVKPVDESLQNRIRSHGREYYLLSVLRGPRSVVDAVYTFFSRCFFPPLPTCPKTAIFTIHKAIILYEDSILAFA